MNTLSRVDPSRYCLETFIEFWNALLQRMTEAGMLDETEALQPTQKKTPPTVKCCYQDGPAPVMNGVVDTPICGAQANKPQRHSNAGLLPLCAAPLFPVFLNMSTDHSYVHRNQYATCW